MREYEIIDITGASYKEIDKTTLRRYIVTGYKFYVYRYLNGDIQLGKFNIDTMDGSIREHISNIIELEDNLVVCSEDLIPYIYE